MEKYSKALSLISILTCTCLYADTWTSKAPMPTPRHGIGSAVVDGKLYGFGGSSEGWALGANEIYDPTLNYWIIAAPIPTPRSGLPAGAVVNDTIYVMGGWTNDVMGSMDVYDPSTNTWLGMTPRYDHACAVVNNKIYAIGGNTGSYFLNVNEVYDPATKTWSTAEPMPTPRSGLGCAVMDGKIYAIGGYNGSFLNVNEIYDPNTNSWTAGTPMPSPRAYFACIALDSLIYAIGGEYVGNIHVGTNEAYNHVGGTWTTKTPMPTPRKGPAFGVINNKIYVAGGSNSYGYLTANEEYDPYTGIAESRTEVPSKHNDVFISITSKEISLTFTSPDESQITVSLYDATGRLQERWVSQEKQNMVLQPHSKGSLAKGVYFVKIEGENLNMTKKVVCMQ